MEELPFLPVQADDFIRSHRLASVATISSPTPNPQLAIVYYICEDSFTLYYATPKEARNATNIRNNHKSAVLIFDEKKLLSLEMEGSALAISEVEKKTQLILKISEATSVVGENFSLPPLTKIPHSYVEIIQFNAAWFKYSDFTKDSAILFEGKPHAWVQKDLLAELNLTA